MSRFLPFNLKDEVWASRAKAILPTTDSGYKSYGTGRLFLPAATNLCTDPQGTLADGTFWPADTANTDTTANVAVPVAVPDNPLITKCLKLVNNGTADAPVTANITVVASTSYNDSIYVFAPTLGGNLTITSEDGHTFSLAALTAANTGFTRYSVQANTVAGEVVKGLKFTFAGGTASTVYVTGYNPIASTILTPYFDGGYPDCVWTGAANASTSTRTASTCTWGPTANGLTIANSTTGTIAFRCVPRWAGNDSVAHYAVFMQRTGPVASFNMAKNASNKWQISVSDGSATTLQGASTVSFASGTAHTLVGRWLNGGGGTLDLNVDGADEAQIANARAPTFVNFGGFSSMAGALGPVILSPVRKSDAWVAAIQANSGAAFSNPMQLWDFLDYGDVLFPLAGDSVGNLKVCGGRPFEWRRIVFDGDSLTNGYGLDDVRRAWPAQVRGRLSQLYECVNVAQNGHSIQACTADAATRVDPLYSSTTNDKNILVIWAGTHELRLWNAAGEQTLHPGYTGESAYNDLVTYVAGRKAVGWKVVLCSIIPRTVALEEDRTVFEAQRADFNARVAAGWAGIADGYADIASSTAFDAYEDITNMTIYQSDGIHLAVGGCTAVADVVTPVLEALV